MRASLLLGAAMAAHVAFSNACAPQAAWVPGVSDAPAVRGKTQPEPLHSVEPKPSTTETPRPAAPTVNLEWWLGSFSVDEACGKSEDGEKMFATHRVKIVKLADHLSAEMSSDGFQTATHLRARIEGTPDHIKFMMVEPLANNVTDHVEPGDLLLEWKRNGDKVSTRWVKITPLCDKASPQFARTGK